ncbi:MAG TPA: alpha/beta fold hydrolase [Acidobacteriota bacterium]|nr:alpha/beta fold hydrolase [Acidobacteriota bacterium]
MKSKFVISLFVILFACYAVQAQEISELIKQFDYDRSASLQLQEGKVETRNGILIKDVTYASPKGGRVSAYLVMPEGSGPFAGIVFAHWGLGLRSEFLPEALMYAEAGVVSVLPDYPWSRTGDSRKTVDDIEHPENDRAAYIQSVVDLRRAIDLLERLPIVDSKRIGYVGHSYGAQWGAILSAADKRLKTCVLIGGVAAGADIWSSPDPDLQSYKSKLNPETLKKYIEVTSILDAIRYVPYAAPTTLLLQFGRYERYFDEASMKRYEKASSDPKKVQWYDTGHELNDVQAYIDRALWLQKELGFKPIQPLIQKRIGNTQ